MCRELGTARQHHTDTRPGALQGPHPAFRRTSLPPQTHALICRLRSNSSINLQSAEEAISPVTYLAATWPGCLRGSRQPRAHHRLQSRVHARLPCLACGNRPLVYDIPSCRVLRPRWKRKNSKQQARLFHYLTGQLLTAAPVPPEPWGRGRSSHVGRAQKFHAGAAEAAAGASTAPSALGCHYQSASCWPQPRALPWGPRSQLRSSRGAPRDKGQLVPVEAGRFNFPKELSAAFRGAEKKGCMINIKADQGSSEAVFYVPQFCFFFKKKKTLLFLKCFVCEVAQKAEAEAFIYFV